MPVKDLNAEAAAEKGNADNFWDTNVIEAAAESAAATPEGDLEVEAANALAAGDTSTAEAEPAPVVAEAAPAVDGAVPIAAEPAAPEVEPVAFQVEIDGANASPFAENEAFVVPGDGLYVAEAAIPKVKEVFAQAATLTRETQQLREQQRTNDALWERRSTHKVKNAEGQEVTLTGEQGIQALRMESVADKAALHTIVAVLSDPNRFAQLVEFEAYDQNGQRVANGTEGASYMPVLSKAAWDGIKRESALSVRERQLAVRDEVSRWGAPVPAPEPSATDFAAPTIEQIAQQNNLTALTPADKAFLAQHFETYTRAATPQEQATYKVPRMVLPSFVELVKDRNALRTEAAKAVEETKTTTAATVKKEVKADKFNTGMKTGIKTPVAGKPAPAGQPSATVKDKTDRFAPKERTAVSANDIWSQLVTEGQEAALGGV